MWGGNEGEWGVERSVDWYVASVGFLECGGK